MTRDTVPVVKPIMEVLGGVRERDWMALQPEAAACAKALRQEDSRECPFGWEEEDTSGKYYY